MKSGDSREVERLLKIAKATSRAAREKESARYRRTEIQAKERSMPVKSGNVNLTFNKSGDMVKVHHRLDRRHKTAENMARYKDPKGPRSSGIKGYMPSVKNGKDWRKRQATENMTRCAVSL